MKTIEVVIDVDGDVTASTSGFSGSDCLKATAELERKLGATTSDKKTSEYLKRGITANRITERR
jgi:hypothetical protein